MKAHIFFIIILIPSLQFLEQLEDDREVAQSIPVTHYVCDPEGFSNADIYSVGEVPDCKMAPEDIELAQADVTIYQKSYLRKVEATRCAVKHSTLSWHCGMHSHSTIRANKTPFTAPLYLTASECQNVSRTGKLNVKSPDSGYHHTINFTEGDTKKHIFSDGKTLKGNKFDCKGKGYIYSTTYQTELQRMNLTYNIRDGTVLNYNGHAMPCKFKSGGCDTLTLDGGAYAWNTSDSCIFVKLQSFPAKMVKYNKRYFIFSSSANAASDMRIEVLPFEETSCGMKTKRLFKTSYDGLYVDIKGGFNVYDGTNHRPINTTQTLTIDTTKGNFEWKESMKEGKYKWFDYPEITSEPDRGDPSIFKNFSIEDINYELHSNIKLDYAIFRTNSLLKQSELELLKIDCNAQRTQIYTILMLAQLNDQLAGYLLTGNHSNFLETVKGGSTAWLYSCDKRKSPLRVMNVCYNRIPIDYQGVLQFVDPISRQTFPEADIIPCGSSLENLFHMDLDDPKSWFTLEPGPRFHHEPKYFEPNLIQPITKFDTYSTTKAGLYSPQQINKFWEKIVSQKRGENILQYLSQELATSLKSNSHRENNGWNRFIPSRNSEGKFYIDNLISPNFFVSSFVNTFGLITYYFTLAGTWFAAFMLLRFLISLIIGALRTFQLQQIAGDSVKMTRIVVDAFFNTLSVAMGTSEDTKVPSQVEVELQEQKLIEKEVKQEENAFYNPYPPLPKKIDD